VGSWAGISAGAFLAFYAFIGFEDMVNVAEEVKNPRKTMPLAIILALSVATILYVLVALVAVLAVPVESLIASDAPLVTVLGAAGPSLRYTITVISIIAITNTGLAQIIMTSRIIYGMARQGTAPKAFGHVHPATRTPLKGTLFVAAIVLVLALWLSVLTLAQATSAIILAVFILVNVALIRVKLKTPSPDGATTYPMWIPVTACVFSFALLAARLTGSLD
jgi:amino acid transporter